MFNFYMSIRRLNKEATSYPTEGPVRFIGSVHPTGDLTAQQWEVTSNDGPLQGKCIGVKVTVPNEYPFKAPEIKLDRDLFHPNVNKRTMCLDTVNNWSPSSTISDVVKEVFETIVTPKLQSAVNTEAGELYLSNRSAYNAKSLASASVSIV